MGKRKTCPALFCIEYQCGDTMATIRDRYELTSDTSIARAVKRAGISRPRGAVKGSHNKGYDPRRISQRGYGWRRLLFYELKGSQIDWSLSNKDVISQLGKTCNMCGKQCDTDDKRWGLFGPDYPTVDHIVPLSRGGSHSWDNVQVLCGRCNCHVKKDRVEVTE